MPSAGRLNSLLRRNENSLDFIRFVAAVAVIFTHSYPYGLGPAHQFDDALAQFTGGQLTFGQLAVLVFFILSGFLVTASIDRSQSAGSYLKARFLRIYPALIVLVVLTVLLLGPLVTHLSLLDYFSKGQTYKYFKVLLLYHLTSYSLPGVFTTNAYMSLLNGSLWTLYWEVLCYGLVLLLWWVMLLRKKVVVALWIGFVTLHLMTLEIFQYDLPTNPVLHSFAKFLLSDDGAAFIPLAIPFVTGMIFYLYRDQIVLKRNFVILGILLFIVSSVYGKWLQEFWVPTYGAYILFYLASLGSFRNFTRYGDFSYGLYIYAPIVQQSVTYVFGGTMQPIVNFVLATPITLVFAVLSWHFVEKPALKLKDRTLVWNRKAIAPTITKV